ncbi:MAG: AlkA N-terminal domain-containing protein, partial [Kibdelosporangium sp.]
FASIRQFNDTIRAVFGTTPTQLRVGARRRRPTSTAGKVSLRLAFRKPFDADGLIAFLGARAVDGVEDVTTEYARTLRLPHGTGTARLIPLPDHIDCTLRLSDMRDLGSAVSRLRRLFDLDADPCAVDELLASDPSLAPSVARTPGIRVPGSVDGAEIVLRALIGQQISVSAARTTLSRLTDALGERLIMPDGDLTTLFPTAQAIAEHGAEVLTGPRRRINTVIEVSSAIASGDLDVHVGAEPDELAAKLETFSGVGPWTSGYVRMRVLGAPDILLPGDVALRNGADNLGITNLADQSAAWRPWRSYAGMHLWKAS